jgi:hypothetical protein
LQLRLICPKVLVANILLSGVGVAEPIRVVVDSIEKASESCGWGHSQHLVLPPGIVPLAHAVATAVGGCTAPSVGQSGHQCSSNNGGETMCPAIAMFVSTDIYHALLNSVSDK